MEKIHLYLFYNINIKDENIKPVDKIVGGVDYQVWQQGSQKKENWNQRKKEDTRQKYNISVAYKETKNILIEVKVTFSF